MTLFNDGRDGTLLYYAALAGVFNQRLPGSLSRDLTLAVGAMSELAGRCLPPLSTFPVEVLPALSFRPSPIETFIDAVCEPYWFRLFMVSDVPVIVFSQDPKGTVNDIAQSRRKLYSMKADPFGES
jgi:hypothetical protein